MDRHNRDLIRTRVARSVTLQILRYAAGMNRSQVAELMGDSRNPYRDYENGELWPRLEKLGRMLETIGADVETFARLFEITRALISAPVPAGWERRARGVLHWHLTHLARSRRKHYIGA